MKALKFTPANEAAIRAGTKTQTRRPIKPVKGFEHNNILKYGMPYAADPWAVWWHGESDRVGCLQECPYGKPGARFTVAGIEHEITEIRAERLQEISEADAMAEGCTEESSEGTEIGPGMFTAKLDFIMLWSTIYVADGPNGWDANPGVWVIGLRRVEL